MLLRGGARGYFIFANFIALAAVLFILFLMPQGLKADAPSAIVISNVQATSITSDSAAVSWSTDLPSSSTVFYQLQEFGSVLQSDFISGDVASHSIPLNSLQAGSIYLFHVMSCDLNGCANSSDFQFSTPASPSVSASPTPTPSPASSPSPIPAPSPSISPSPTGIPGGSSSPSATPSVSIGASPTATASSSPTPIFSPTPSPEPFPNASASPSSSASPSPSIQTNAIQSIVVALAPPQTGCDLVTSNVVMTADIRANYTCYNITTSGVIFDCNGYSITGNTSGYGFNVTNANNIVIQNCVIINFTRGISAQTAVNLTLINNTFINETNFGIHVVHSSNSNLSLQILNDFNVPSVTAAIGNNATAVYLQNFSNSALIDVSINRMTGGNSSALSGKGGSAFGIFLLDSHNNSMQNIWVESITGGSPSHVGRVSVSGNATAIHAVRSNHSTFRNLTFYSINGGIGASLAYISGVLSNGGNGGYAYGVYLQSSLNTSFENVTMQNLTGGNGGNGDNDDSEMSSTGGVGGNAAFVYLTLSADHSFANLTFLNLTAGAGGKGGPGLPGGSGTGGIGGDAYGIWLSAFANNNSFAVIDERQVKGGEGGIGGDAGTGMQGKGGNGGNASFFTAITSNNNSLLNAFMNSSIGGANGTGNESIGVPLGGAGYGVYLFSSNFTFITLVEAQNISAGVGLNASSYGNTSAINFIASSFNTISNSTFRELYLNPLSYSIISWGNSYRNLFINTTFNKSAAGWAGAVNNFTVNWYVAVNLTNALGGGIGGAAISVYNMTSSTVAMSTQTTAANGLTNWFAVTEYYANGSNTYNTYCALQNTAFCYGPHNFTWSSDGYKPNSTSLNITYSQIVWYLMPNYPPTQNAPSFSPNPPETGSNLTCLNQSTVDADGDRVTNIYSMRFNESGGLANDTLLFYAPFDTDVTYGSYIKDYSPYNSSRLSPVIASPNNPTWKKYNDDTYGSSVIGGGAYYFNGVFNAFTMNLTLAPQLVVKDNLTYSLWFNSSLTGSASAYLLSTKDYLVSGPGTYEILRTIAGGSGRIDIVCRVQNSSSLMSTQYDLSRVGGQYKLTFVACTYNTTSLVMYINGSETNRSDLDTPARVVLNSGTNLTIGIQKGSNPFEGLIDEVRIYNKTLSPEQIALLYQMRFNATAAQELAVNMNATCCVTPTDTYADGVTKCVSDKVIAPTASSSFTVYTLGSSGTNYSTSTLSLPGNYTEGYFFNTTNSFAQLLAPCGNADGVTDCQNGENMPAYRIRNTGSANISIWMNLSSSLTGTGVNFCGNSTMPAGCATGVVSACDLSGQGNINASAWFLAASNIGTDSICFDANVTIYANFTNVGVGVPVVRVLTINSTLT